MKNAEIIKFSTLEWANNTASLLNEHILSVLAQKKQCNVVLTGGRTAQKLYEAWKNTIDLEQISGTSFYLGDERYIPLEHSDSNYNLVMSALFSGELPRGCKFYAIESHVGGIDLAANTYEKLLPKCIDMLLLTLGDDGHIASIFPGDIAIFETTFRFVASKNRAHLYPRLTLSPIGLSCAEKVFVLAIGTQKKQILRRCFDGSSDILQLPARLVLGATWITDC